MMAVRIIYADGSTEQRLWTLRAIIAHTDEVVSSAMYGIVAVEILGVQP